MLGEKPRTLTDNPDDKAFHKKIWLTLISKGEWEGEVALRHKSGEVIPVWATMSANMSEQGELLNYCAYFLTTENTVQAPFALEEQKQQSPH